MADVYTLGQIVPLEFLVTNEASGLLANATAASVVITKPDNTTSSPTLTNTQTGVYTLDYAPPAIGRYVAVFTATGTNAGSIVKVFDVYATTGAVITLAQVKDYLGVNSWTDAEIQGALDAERAAQTRACRIDEYGPDLREALYRRVAVNLASRNVPLAQFNTFETGGAVSTRATVSDPVVKRLEAPYRRLVVG